MPHDKKWEKIANGNEDVHYHEWMLTYAGEAVMLSRRGECYDRVGAKGISHLQYPWETFEQVESLQSVQAKHHGSYVGPAISAHAGVIGVRPLQR